MPPSDVPETPPAGAKAVDQDRLAERRARFATLLLYELLGPAILGAMIYELMRPEIAHSVFEWWHHLAPGSFFLGLGAALLEIGDPSNRLGIWITRCEIIAIFALIWLYLKCNQKATPSWARWKARSKRRWAVWWLDLAALVLFAVAFAIVEETELRGLASAVVGVIAVIYGGIHWLRWSALPGDTQDKREFRRFIGWTAFFAFLAALPCFLICALAASRDFSYRPLVEHAFLAIVALLVLIQIWRWKFSPDE